MSDDKEVRFFTDPGHLSWVGRYQDYFAAGTTYRGESTPQYTKWPVFPGVVDRMADLVPDARLIYLVRDPVERAIAEYVEEATWGVITEDIESALGRTSRSRTTGSWRRVATPPSCASSIAASTRRRCSSSTWPTSGTTPPPTMRQIFGFLDLPPIDLDEEALRPRNSYGDKGALPGWYQALRRPAPDPAGAQAADRAAGPGADLRHPADQQAGRASGAEPGGAGPAARAELGPEVEDLRKLTGLAFAGWSV